MRTVLQTQATYPSLQSFVLNILQTLILKQVNVSNQHFLVKVEQQCHFSFKIWKDKSLWNGFIKCCEKLIPHSYAVILQLPPANLEDFFQALPHVRDPLLEHVQVIL
jgi:symplekin